jgi:hypothetical protein
MPGWSGLNPINTHTKWCLGNGEWTMELVWRPEDFESPICFVWLTKQRRNNYSVAETSFAVNSHASPDAGAKPSAWDAGLLASR